MPKPSEKKRILKAIATKVKTAQGKTAEGKTAQGKTAEVKALSSFAMNSVKLIARRLNDSDEDTLRFTKFIANEESFWKPILNWQTLKDNKDWVQKTKDQFPGCTARQLASCFVHLRTYARKTVLAAENGKFRVASKKEKMQAMGPLGYYFMGKSPHYSTIRRINDCDLWTKKSDDDGTELMAPEDNTQVLNMEEDTNDSGYTDDGDAKDMGEEETNEEDMAKISDDNTVPVNITIEESVAETVFKKYSSILRDLG